MDAARNTIKIHADANRAMFQETLLTYRILFGQDRDARRLFRSQEKERASAGGITDPLLIRLCGDDQDIAQLTHEDIFHEQDFYDSAIDFPWYGNHLVFLQEYTSRRKARNVKDLWRDRRDPERWVLVWLVIILTVISIVLSLVQIGLGAAQVRLAQLALANT